MNKKYEIRYIDKHSDSMSERSKKVFREIEKWIMREIVPKVEDFISIEEIEIEHGHEWDNPALWYEWDYLFFTIKFWNKKKRIEIYIKVAEPYNEVILNNVRLDWDSSMWDKERNGTFSLLRFFHKKKGIRVAEENIDYHKPDKGYAIDYDERYGKDGVTLIKEDIMMIVELMKKEEICKKFFNSDYVPHEQKYAKWIFPSIRK